MNKTKKPMRPALVVLISGLAGVAVFLSLYGFQVLDPACTDWLMDGGTLSRGYWGWRLFQSSDWQFPFGVIGRLGYARQASIAAEDSIPLLAVLCKLLSPLYEGPFQYFGWWGLVCFMLQGVFGGLLCLRITRSNWQAVLGGFMFIMSPILWQSTFANGGLAGHWVLLAALLTLVNRQALSARRRLPFVAWALLGALSIGIHARLAFMCGIFCAGYCLYAALESKEWKKSLPFLSFLLAVLAVGGILGVLSGIGEIRFFGIDATALWEPRSYSRVLRDFANPTDHQYTGFAYLGFGMLWLCALALVWLVKRLFSSADAGRDMLSVVRAHRADVLAFALVGLASLALGLAQPTVYLLMAGAIFLLTRYMSKRLVSATLICCLCLQAYDASVVWEARAQQYRQIAPHAQAFAPSGLAEFIQTSDSWTSVAISPAVSQSVYLAPLAEGIAQSSLTLGALSYADASSLSAWAEALSSPREDMIFIFTAEEMLEDQYFRTVFSRIGYLYQWDELIIGFARSTLLPYPQILGVEDITLAYRYPFNAGKYLKGGEDIGGIRYLYPGGLSYGPYITLGAGQYRVRITGEHLEEAQISFTTGKGTAEPTQVLSRPSERVYRVEVTQDVMDLEILIKNGTARAIYVDAMTITQID